MESIEAQDPNAEYKAFRDMETVKDRLTTAVGDVLARDQERSRLDGVDAAIWHRAAIETVSKAFRQLFEPHLGSTDWNGVDQGPQAPVLAELSAWVENDLQSAELPRRERQWLRGYILREFQEMLAEGIRVRLEAVVDGSGKVGGF